VLRWSDDKNQWLLENRGVAFQEVAESVLGSSLLDVIESPGRSPQQAFVVRMRGYVWVVPFVLEKDGTIFLKTAYPSRKMMSKYGGSYGPKGQA
jgi:uncharacterized DUF497 family protein